MLCKRVRGEREGNVTDPDDTPIEGRVYLKSKVI